MVGYIVGVGMFSLPFLTVRAGWAVFLLMFFVLGLMQYLVHLIYANIIILDNSFHRLPGYVGRYFGKLGKYSVFTAKMIGSIGALLAYLIISSIFLRQLIGSYFGQNLIVYASVIALLCALIVYRGVKALSRAELFMSFLLFITVWLLAYKGADVQDFSGIPVWDRSNIFLPYGAMLVALDGIGSLPVVGRLIQKDAALFKNVIRSGLVLSAVVMAVFVFAIVGISGPASAPDALSGIGGVVTPSVYSLALIFGLLSIFTSIIGVSEAVKETLNWDFRINEKLSWAFAVFLPYVLYLSGITDLVGVISFIGAVGGGYCSFMLLLTFLEIKKKNRELKMFKRVPSSFVIYFLMFLFLAGIAHEISKFFK